MPLKLNSTSGGSVTLQEPTTASNRTLTLPDATGTVNTSGAVNEVPAGSASAPSIYPTGDTNTGIFFPAADTIAFVEGGVEAMRIDSSANVGIGTSSPVNKLQVSSGGADVARFTNTLSNGGDWQFKIGGGGFEDRKLMITDRFGGADNVRVAINSSGNFLVNTTSTFDVTSGATTQLSGQCAVYNSGSPNTLMSFYNSSQSARVGFIGSSGNSTSYNSGSDYRLKDNVINISGALSKISTLRPVTFTWKISPEVGVVSGFIAHELDEVVPEAVTGEKDAMCSDGVTPDYQMVDQSKLVPLLVAAIKEQQAMIEELKAKVAALEAK